MHVRIRKVNSETEDTVITVSKTSLVQDIQEIIRDKLDVEIEHQRLFYRGKQLVPDFRIVDYDVKLNDVIQLMIQKHDSEKAELKEDNENSKKIDKTPTDSRYYKIGDRIDVIDNDNGGWFEAKIIEIFTKKTTQNLEESDLIFKVQMDRNVETVPFEVKFADIRPRALHIYEKSELIPGMVVFVNYNMEEPTQRGYWYDFEVIQVTKKDIKGTLLVGKDRTPIENCKIKFVDEIMKIEEVKLLNERHEVTRDIPMRKLPLYCNKCKDITTKKCRECGCKICAKKEKVGVLILCDECDDAYHLTCLEPALSEIPKDEWYCPECKNDDSEIIKAGEKLKLSKKKMKMPSNKENSKNKDWGKGMACVGRRKTCTIVQKHHYGPIPGVDVGTNWEYRVQVAEAGVHRPQIAGIHGCESDGAYSLVLSGGYEDDVDFGDEFYYTGAGGRNLSGNKRVGEQSHDQTLTSTNKALALNCNTQFNDVTGGEARDWRKGKPVRVVRNFKLRRHSKFAPVEGNRYDGIYKVVKYYPVTGKSGFIVWRYLLRRDDTEPAPWHKNGKEYPMIRLSEENTNSKKKRKLSQSNDSPTLPKKSKIQPYKIEPKINKFISADEINQKLWDECKETLNEGKQKFFSKLEEIFICVCCQEILFEPVTVTCKHNVCKKCLKRSFAAEIYTCPWCRFDLSKKFVMNINYNLFNALKALFPGYERGR